MPGLPWFCVLLPMMLLGAFLWRLRGGLLNDLTGQENYPILGIPFNDTVVRIIWSVGMALAFWLIHPNFYWIGEWICNCGVHPSFLFRFVAFVFLVLTLFAGTTVFGWFGAELKPASLYASFPLSLSGILRLSFMAVLLWNAWPLLAGLLFGPMYWLGTKLKVTYKWEFWGEILCGAAQGFCFVFA
jgi:hypothetical protein